MNILVLDDEPMALKLVMNLVSQLEPTAELRGCQTVKDAIELSRAQAPDIAFLDINVGNDSGLQVARVLKALNPKTNIIFCTAYSEYAREAVSLHSSGYIMKPPDKEDIRRELDNLLYPIQSEMPQIYAHTFGNFDLLIRGKALNFSYSKAKEMLAYLIDRDGAAVTRRELAAVLFEDIEYSRNTQNYLTKIYISLKEALESVGAGELVCKGHNQYRVDTTQYDSDLRQYRLGVPSAINAFNGEYMSQYSWAEATLGAIYSELNV